MLAQDTIRFPVEALSREGLTVQAQDPGVVTELVGRRGQPRQGTEIVIDVALAELVAQRRKVGQVGCVHPFAGDVVELWDTFRDSVREARFNCVAGVAGVLLRDGAHLVDPAVRPAMNCFCIKRYPATGMIPARNMTPNNCP